MKRLLLPIYLIIAVIIVSCAKDVSAPQANEGQVIDDKTNQIVDENGNGLIINALTSDALKAASTLVNC